jgi:hypothetical protein
MFDRLRYLLKSLICGNNREIEDEKNMIDEKSISYESYYFTPDEEEIILMLYHKIYRILRRRYHRYQYCGQEKKEEYHKSLSEAVQMKHEFESDFIDVLKKKYSVRKEIIKACKQNRRRKVRNMNEEVFLREIRVLKYPYKNNPKG